MIKDRNSAFLFKVYDVVNELECPPLVKDSTFLSPNELKTGLSKLRDKWVEKFDSLFDLYGDNMHTWTIYYVKLNHNVYVLIFKAHDNLFEIEKETSDMKIK